MSSPVIAWRAAISLWVNRNRKWILSGPAIAFIVLLLVIPLGYTLYLSFTDAGSSLRASFHFTGLGNYTNVLTDTRRFWPAVYRTVLFTVGAVSVEMLLGAAIALLLRREFRGQGIVRVIILMPLVATPVAVAMLWRLIFEPTIGFANEFLRFFGLPGSEWLSSPSTALPTLMFIDVWQWTPMVALLLLAGLTTVPEEPEEAARVDGANVFQRFWFVTLPLMRSVVFAALILRSVEAFKTFDILYATKGAGGGSMHEAETINIYAYGINFSDNRYGLASAVLVVFFIMVLVLVTLQIVARRRGQ
ncbi:carbohydrate ABC transporter permease [Demequina lutea]|uniref:Multiple sugar transport system permease protein n=1 Tax=Demequina lutea TaxID=431489 RepID=A0A7Y9ZAG9_9MICO|nr:sugar ABC transporter permease [Demequina lutea]NYI40510.1 multiple sugar transport system permease protein [Demequina lutea]